MQYILLQTEQGNFIYQEIERGTVVRYCDLDGNTIEPPFATSANPPAWIINANPPFPSWGLPDTPPPEPPPSRILTRLEFRNRFTMAEKVAIYNAANSNVEIKIWLDDLACAESVDLFDPQTQQSLEALVQSGLLTEQRKNEILNA